MAKAKPKRLPFNEKSVLREMAKELDVSIDDLSIEDYDPGFGTGDMFRVEHGRAEYVVARNDTDAHALAIAMVTQDLENEPEIFNKDFIESHIDKDRLRRDLMSDVQNMKYEDLKEEAEQRPEKFIKDNDLDSPEPGEEIAVSNSDVETVAEREAEEVLKDPIGYLEDIYGREEAMAKAIEIAGIDVREAADEAVRTDGEGHFLSSYDGNTNNTHSGFVYWRTN